ncbi:hypothetical protein Tco_0574530, partial [Tanacetum coccineum]
KLNLISNSTTADKENRFHLFHPLGQANDSFGAFKIHRLALQEVSVSAFSWSRHLPKQQQRLDQSKLGVEHQ